MEDNKYNSSMVNNIVCFCTSVLSYFDVVVLMAVSIGIVALSIFVLTEGFSDLIAMIAHSPTSAGSMQHSPTHVVSDLMFVLIIMELMRQVIRQLQQQPFSLNPFLFIGVIASIRGILIVMMSLAMGEVEWVSGVVRLGVYITAVLVLTFCYHLNTKTEKECSSV